ncbi:carph-isopro domain-containing protein [Novosphingobium sp. PP1Y]|uniref:carph-isopro domain-containing protein n=1 Tax=Novosphingobium sp. PP1Y TaxID=702113 RepID=UPI00350F6EE3
MVSSNNIFDTFGGIRSMARAIGEPSSTVFSWKRGGRIPAHKQPIVLEVGQALGLPVTAEHVVFPLGRPDLSAPALVASERLAVVCDRQAGLQRKGRGR